MSAELFTITYNTDIIDLDSWIDRKRLPDGSYALTGFGSRTDRSETTGEVTYFNVSPTGVNGWAPHDAFGEPRTLRQWLAGVFAGDRYYTQAMTRSPIGQAEG